MEEEEKVEVKFIATITGQKGTCHANHQLGQKFELNRIEVECPDRYNTVSLKIERKK